MSGVDWIDSVYAPPAAAAPWRFEELLAPARLRYYGLGRAALADVLRCAGLRAGDPALFPAYVCREAVDAARALGCAPLFYPVGADLAPASDPVSWPAARAVVAVNFFGFPQDLEPFRRYAARAGAALIEDNAHGLFSRDASGACLGLRADAGVFSPRKTIAVPNGGLAAFGPHSPLPVPQLGAFRPGLPAAYRAKQTLRAAAARWGRGPVRSVLKLSRVLRRERAAQGRALAAEPAPPTLLAEPIRVADPTAEAGRRRALYRWSEERVGALGGAPVFAALPQKTSPYVFPFRAAAADAARIRAALDRDGLDVFPWPALPPEVEASAPGHYRDVFCVRFLW